MQTRTTQRRMLESAAHLNELHRLYWFISMRIPGYMRPDNTPVESAASYPKGWIPLIPMGDPDESRHYADLLCESFKLANKGRGIEFTVTITSDDLIAGMYTYHWGDEITALVDHLCPLCGIIKQLPANQSITTCMAWCC